MIVDTHFYLAREAMGMTRGLSLSIISYPMQEKQAQRGKGSRSGNLPRRTKKGRGKARAQPL